MEKRMIILSALLVVMILGFTLSLLGQNEGAILILAGAICYAIFNAKEKSTLNKGVVIEKHPKD